MALLDAIIAVEDAIVQRIIDTAIPDVKGVVYSRALRWGDLKNPYVRIFPTPSIVDDNSPCTIKENWTFNWTLMAVAASYNTKDHDQAREIALQLASAVLWDPITGLPDRHLTINSIPYVQDIVRTLWHSEFTLELPDEILFGAAIEVEARQILSEV